MTEAASSDNEDLGAALPPAPSPSGPPAPTPSGPPLGPPEPRPAARPRPGTGRQSLVVLAAFLVLVIAAVAASPFWAPAVAPLLPWGRRAAAPSADYAALAARLDAIENRPAASPGISAATLDAVRSTETALAQRLDRLEAATASPDAGLKSSNAATEAEQQRFAQRLDAAAAQSTRTAAGLQQAQQDLARLDKLAADLAARAGALEGRSQAEIGAGRTDAALLLSLMQLREAVEAGRPFAPEYAGFTALAQGHPDLVAAARPLAAGAPNGIASRAALRQGLAELADRLATAASPPDRQTWWEAALARLRGLVTIRRIDAPPTSPEAVVDRAQAVFAAGDLAGAVSALAALSGIAADSARPWLQMARSRLAAEAALAGLQQLLTARLVAAPATLPRGTAPASTPNAGPAKPGAPS
jgi:hypothetical protein